MATSREHFALDWIKGELLETLNTARGGLETFAEALESGDASDSPEVSGSLRKCVNGLHQAHGTLVMLELKGVTLLADHLERVAEHLMNGDVEDVSGACQSLMQGILELPGYLDELQTGVPDTEAAMVPLANELRRHLGEPALQTDEESVHLYGIASEDAVARFEAIDGIGKSRKIRAAYQQVLLSLLKGGDLDRAVDTLRKVAHGMIKVCDGTPFAAQWQAFGEFVESLGAGSGGDSLDGGAVKLLRRVDSEIREIAQSGSAALRRPVSINLVRQLVDAAAERGRSSPALDALRDAAARGGRSDSLSLSGRQALVSAATALREELGTIKDRLDLFVRGGGGSAPASLSDLLAPLKQVGSTLSLLGFESSRSIVLDQVDVLGSLVERDQADEATILNIAGALVQVDENLASLTHSGKGEVEQITDEAQRAVARQTREGLDHVKQSIVDYVSSQWDVRHLQETPAELDGIIGALNMIPLAQAAELVGRCQDYLRLELMAGHVPTWEELDRLADALSGIDYYLERLASDNPGGAEDVLDVVGRSLNGLGAGTPSPGGMEAAADTPAPEGEQPHFGGAEDVDPTTVGSGDGEAEPELSLEADEDFDLDSPLFDEISGTTTRAAGNEDEIELDEATLPRGEETGASALDEAEDAPAPISEDAEAGPADLGETEWQLELEDEPGEDGEVAATAAPAKPPPSFADSFESDDEIVEIFVEEVGEVLEAVDEHLDAWAESLGDESRQTEIRRAFHTLKGSGRMVGANVLAELSWSVENMLNRVLDGTVEPTAEFVAVVRLARDLVPRLKEAFEQKSRPEMTAVGRVMEQADVLASGGTLTEAADVAGGAEPAPSADAAPRNQEESDAAEPRPAGVAEEDEGLFVAEAETHIDTLRAACRDDGFLLDDGAMRALHTLSGSAAMAGVATFGELSSPTYELAQAVRRPGSPTTLSGDAGGFFRDATAAMAAMLEDLKAGREPEEQYQLIADVDRLLSEAGDAAGASSTLLGLPALGTLLGAGDLLERWHEGAVDLALADEVREALAEVERVARAEDQAAVSALTRALLGAHDRLEFEILGDEAFVVLKRGHEALLTQLDELAAGQTPSQAADERSALEALRPAPTGSEPASAPAAERPADEELPEEPEEALTAERPAREFDLDLEAPELPDAGEPEASAPGAGEAHAEPVDDRGLVPEEVDADIIEVFFEETDEILEALDHSINDWSDEPDNRLHMENILRGLHTLKGGARLSGLTRLGDETHDFESYLIEFQESARPAERGLFDELHGRHDSIAALVVRIKAALAGEPVPDAPGRPPIAPPTSQPSEPDAGPPEGHSEVSPGATHEPHGDGVTPPLREAGPPPDNVSPLHGREAAQAADPPARAGSAVPKEPSSDERPEPAAAQARAAQAQEMVRVGAGLLESLVNLAGESSIIRARVEQGMSDFTTALDEMETTIERLREQLRRLEIETETQVLFRQELEGPSYEDFDPLEMDRYSQLQQLSRSLGESASDMLDLKETLLSRARDAETLLLQQARVNTELQEGLMRSRMVPFSRLLPRLKRTVRQVARELGKDVGLKAFNVEGELDRTLLERMVPPLEHMLRNAVDHGIESAEARRAGGKPESGHIELRLSREGGDVVIEISDDGAGIDVERVRAKAVERGLMAADASLRDEEIAQFVLAPGFSTAKSVTQISGRGVGMDVVASEVKQLGGSIDILSQPGRGTRFVVRVPFTVSVNRALMVSVGEDLYAIPLNTIEGIVLLSAEELEHLYAPDGNTFEYAGVPYRVQYLGNFLGRQYHPQPMRSSVPVVLVRSGEHAVAVHVDGVQGSREIVVKSLGPQFAGVGGISGATILGDGSVVVILDLLALIRTQSGGLGAGQRKLTGAPRTRCVMVVDDSVTVRKVTSRLLERQGMDVVVAKDGVEAVSLLQERRPDVMLLDIEMPRMDGFEVLRQVRHDDRLKDLPIVMISSRTGTKHQDRAAELGVSRFLGKPFQESELLSTIDELVE